jgi:hypothetical protein
MTLLSNSTRERCGERRSPKGGSHGQDRCSRRHRGRGIAGAETAGGRNAGVDGHRHLAVEGRVLPALGWVRPGFGYELAWWLQEHGVAGMVIAPSRVERMPGLQVKTDRVDVGKLARKLEKGDLKAIYIPSRTVHEQRQLGRTYAQSLYLGLTPSQYRSGELDHRGHTLKCGPGFLRALLQCAWSAVRQGRDTDLKECFDRLALRIGRKRAIVAVARKLAIKLRGRWRTHLVSSEPAPAVAV